MIYILILFQLLASQSIMYFNGERAMDYLEFQCSLGPRYPGSQGHDDFISYINQFLEDRADEVYQMNDIGYSSVEGKDVDLSTFMARFNASATERIMIMAHWDTRRYADMESDTLKAMEPILGANDGASGVAVLMVLTEILRDNPLANIGVDLLFIDGENMGVSGVSDSWGTGTDIISSKLIEPYPEYAICLDMVGDKDQQFYIEGFSFMYGKEVVRKVWELANDLGFYQFINEVGKPIIDDHYVLMKNTGIVAIDVIDFEYPNSKENYWHTLEDTPDKCSAKSLEAVGTVIASLIYLEDNK